MLWKINEFLAMAFKKLNQLSTKLRVNRAGFWFLTLPQKVSYMQGVHLAPPPTPEPSA
jgi:hypothetical protein